jgi:hypothetical protein
MQQPLAWHANTRAYEALREVSLVLVLAGLADSLPACMVAAGSAQAASRHWRAVQHAQNLRPVDKARTPSSVRVHPSCRPHCMALQFHTARARRATHKCLQPAACSSQPVALCQRAVFVANKDNVSWMFWRRGLRCNGRTVTAPRERLQLALCRSVPLRSQMQGTVWRERRDSVIRRRKTQVRRWSVVGGRWLVVGVAHRHDSLTGKQGSKALSSWQPGSLGTWVAQGK